MNILENYYMIDIPTESEELAKVVWSYSYDWAVALDFIQKLADARGIVVKSWEVAKIIKEQYLNEI